MRFGVSWVLFPRDLVGFFFVVCNGSFSGKGDVIVHVVFVVDLWGRSGKGKVW